jgi:hypothetical protein
MKYQPILIMNFYITTSSQFTFSTCTLTIIANIEQVNTVQSSREFYLPFSKTLGSKYEDNSSNSSQEQVVIEFQES